MRTVNVNSKTITLGRQMEDNATQVIFDLSDLISTFGNGTATLVHQRKQDTAPYIVSDVVQDGSTLTWTVTDTDTAYRGPGELELRWVVGDTLAKSIIYQTKVLASITADIAIPEALQSWYDAMIAYIDANSSSATAVTYTLSIDDRTITLTGSDDSTVSVTVPDTDLSDYMTADAIATAISTAVGAIVVPTKTSDLENDSGYITDAGVTSFNGASGAITYTAPVTSVNGSTGAVMLTASDVGALDDDTSFVSSVNGASGAVTLSIPTKTSELQNDSGFLTEHQSLASYYTKSETDALLASKASTAVATTSTNGLMTTIQVTQLEACYTDYTAMLALI